MYRAGAFLVLSVLVSGCVADGATSLPLSLDRQAAVRMESTTSVLQKRRIAAATCLEAGYRLHSADTRQCVRALIVRDAQRHGMCMAQKTFRIARCIEI